MKPAKLIILKITRGIYSGLKTLLEGILRLTFFLLLLLGVMLISIRIPSVQKKLVDVAAEMVSEKLHFPVTIGAVDINWVDEIGLRNVVMKDPHGEKMIYLGRAIVDFKILRLLAADIAIENVTLQDGGVNLIAYKNGNLNMNDFIDAISAGDSTKLDHNRKPSPFKVPSVTLVNMSFTYNDVTQVPTSDFDYSHFGFDSIYANVYNLKILGDTFQIDVKKLKAIETHTRLRIHELSTDYRISTNNMEFNSLDARIGESHVKKYMNFGFSEIGNLTYFIDSTTVTLDAEESVISLRDLGYFDKELKPFKDKIRLSGLFKGKVGNFGVRNLSLGLGKNTIFKGRLELKGLPFVQETFIDFSFKESLLDARDIKQYCDAFTYRQFQKFGTISGKGKFMGFANDFVASGIFSTGLGSINTDINFKLDEKGNSHAFYEGKVLTKGFNLGKLIELSDYIGKIDMDGHIEGEGFALENAEVKVNVKIGSLQFNGYTYKNIKTKATLQNRLFDGLLEVNDSNLVIKTLGKIDLRKNKNIINISGEIGKANLLPLNFSPNNKEVLLKTNFFFDYTGLQIDQINGRAGLVNTYLLYKGVKEVQVDSLIIETYRNNQGRTLNINSDLLTLAAHGNFNFTTLAIDAQRLFKEYSMSLTNSFTEQQKYYAAKRNTSVASYQLNFDVHAKNINQILSIYVPNLYLSSGFFLKGDFTAGQHHLLNGQAFIDTVYYNGNELIKSELELSTSKAEYVKDVTASLFINSKSQKLQSGFKSMDLYFEGNWKSDSINFRSKVFQQDSKDYIKLNGDVKLGDRTQTLTLKNSEINILNQIWSVEPHNKVFITKSTLGFENLTIENGQQYVSLQGEMSDDPEHESRLVFNDFKMENINPLMKSTKLKGNLNAGVTLKNVFSGLQVVGNIALDTFMVDGFLIGDIKGATTFDNNKNIIKAGVQVMRDDIKVIDVLGDFYPGSDTSDNKLNLRATLKSADLEILNPMMEGVLSHIGGKASGSFNITGSTKNISIKGNAHVTRGRFSVPYLGTTYYFEDQIYLTENLIGFKNLLLKDPDGHTGLINGGLYHDHFDHFIVDIKGLLNDLKLLQTTEKNNKQFYGDAVVSGDIEILGTFDDLQINAHAKTKKGTRIFIPINSGASLEQQSYIKFITKTDKKAATLRKDSVDVSGLKMEFNVEITPDAYTEIIFDKRTGDIIRGYGQGNLKLKIDTRGDFTMEGDFSFTEGWYNFTLAGLINKEFRIKSNSSINWSGEPYLGVMNINAEYSQFVSMKPLLTDSSKLKDSEMQRKYPTVVKLGLTGNLLSPDIKMGIDILRNPSFMNDVVTAFKAKLATNEQEMNRQVFSVLILGGFAPESSFSGIASSANNLSEMLSAQLSNWLSQVDDKLQVDVNLNSLDRNALNTFQMRLSYTLLDGRLRITRDGSFRNVQNTSQTNFSNLAGEWTIEYLLSTDGKFRLKLFNRTNQNILLNSAGGNSTGSAGFSVLHTQNFNSLRDLVKPDNDNISREINDFILKKNQEDNELINSEGQQKDSSRVPANTNNAP